MTVVFVILVVAAILFLLGYSLKLFRFERVADKPAPENPPPEEEEEPQGEELVDLVEYFGDRLEPETEKKPVPDPPAEEPTYDKLTNLMAGRHYLVESNRLLAAALEAESRVAVACFDIDRFRFINSVKGYSLGDYVLNHLALEAVPIFPKNALITRLSADHFAAVFPTNDMLQYEALSDELRRFCDRIRLDIAVKSNVRISMGIAEAAPEEGKTAYNMDILLRKANLARHCLKAARAENFSLYNDTIVTSLLYGESALEDYSENQYSDEIVLLMQPMTDLLKNTLAGSDALAYWVCQESSIGVVTPENGRLPTNNTKVFYQVFRAMSRWRKAGKELLPMYIHIPETELFKADLDEFFIKACAEFQLEAAVVYAVVDGGSILLNPEVAANQIQKLRDTGMQVGVWMDSIYGTLDFLSGLPISFVKFSRGFTQDLRKNPDRANAIRSLIAAAKELRFKTIFEGVDDTERMKEIQNMGADVSEGRYSGRTVSFDDFGRMMDVSILPRATGDSTVILTDADFKRGNYHV
jgi:diguanylate cyclase (GGDEF)-like protein